MNILKSLVVKLVGDKTELSNCINQSQQEFDKFGKSVDKNGMSLKAFAQIAAGVGAAIVGSFMAMTLAEASNARQIEELSQKVGMSAEDWQKLAKAAKGAGVDQDTLAGGLEKLSKNMDAATSGSGKQAEAFAKLGINVQNNDKTLRNSGDVLLQISDKFHNMKDGTDKTALAIQLFGKSGADMIPMLNQGSEKIKAVGDAALAMGGILSNEAIEKLATLNKTVESTKGLLGNFAKQVAVDSVPVVQGFADAVKWIIGLFFQLPEPVRQCIVAAVGLTGAVAAIGGAFLLITPATWAALAPLLPFVAAAAALGVAGSLIVNNWNPVAAFFMNVWDKVVNIVKINIASIVIEFDAVKLAILEGLNAISGFIPGWGDKLKKSITDVTKDMHAQVQTINDNAHAMTKSNYDKHLAEMKASHKKGVDDNKELTQEEIQQEQLKLKAQQEAAQKSKELTQKLDKELFDLTHTDSEAKLNDLKAEETKELSQENLTTAQKLEIQKIYQLKRQQLQQQEGQKQQQLQQQIDKHLYDSSHNELQKKFKDLADAENKELMQVGLTEEQKNEIIQAYANDRKKIYEEEAAKKQDAYNAQAAADQNYLDQLRTGQTTGKEIVKENLISQLGGLEKTALAQIAAGIAAAWGQAPATWGASLTWLAPLFSAQGAEVAAIEAAKYAIKGLATGGVTTGPSVNLIGEAGPEAVIPLTKPVLNQIGQGIAQASNTTNNSSTSNSNITINIGTFVADKPSKMKLAREINDAIIQDNIRRGVPNK